ncbi:unnamed protein product [Onchocerca flexuosa]|uniref:Uncharacterized protein n=1 Tax=Onchocerca flexuosa TaxID=387005 RepID=A0A183H3P4_9BILA|nr:unnamed protein product [Onchocerca flexuosa]
MARGGDGDRSFENMLIEVFHSNIGNKNISVHCYFDVASQVFHCFENLTHRCIQMLLFANTWFLNGNGKQEKGKFICIRRKRRQN